MISRQYHNYKKIDNHKIHGHFIITFNLIHQKPQNRIVFYLELKFDICLLTSLSIA